MTLLERMARAYWLKRGGEWHLDDLGSLNGTYVNRQPVTETQLQSGDEVQIGKYRFRFMSGAPVDR